MLMVKDDEAESDTTSMDIESEPPRSVRVWLTKDCMGTSQAMRILLITVFSFCSCPSDILDPTGEEVLRSSPTISSPSPSLTHDDDEISTGSSNKGGVGPSICGASCERVRKEDELSNSTEVGELVESPTKSRRAMNKVGLAVYLSNYKHTLCN